MVAQTTTKRPESPATPKAKASASSKRTKPASAGEGAKKAAALDLGFYSAVWSNFTPAPADAATVKAVENAEAMMDKNARALGLSLSPSPLGRNRSIADMKDGRAEAVHKPTRGWYDQVQKAFPENASITVPYGMGLALGTAYANISLNAGMRGPDGTADERGRPKLIKNNFEIVDGLLNDRSIRAPESIREQFEKLDQRLAGKPGTPAQWLSLKRDLDSWFSRLLTFLRSRN